MADIKNLPADLQGLPSIPCNGSRYYYKEGKDGQRLLVAQLFGKSHFIIRYPEGSTIDVIPEGAVGSKQIEDGSVQMEDLNDEVKDKIPEGYADDDDVDQMFKE
jgi:hypothetical protein